MAYTTPSTQTVGTLIGTTEWDRDIINNIINLAEGPYMIRTSAGQAVGSGSFTPLNYETLVDASTRTGSVIVYSTTDDEFNLPQTGRYLVQGSAVWGVSTNSTVGLYRQFNISSSTAAGAGAPIGTFTIGAPNSTTEELGGCFMAEARITSTSQKIVIKAFQDSGANLSVQPNSTSRPNRVSIRWVGPV